MADAREPSDEENEAVSDWKRHPLTELVARGFETEASKAMTELLGAARGSSDPKVAKWVARYDTLVAAKKTITGED